MVKPPQQAASQLRLLKEHGLNTILLKDSRYSIQEKLLLKWGGLSRQEELQFFPVFNFSGKSEIKRLRDTFPPYYDRNGLAYPATPCPLNKDYWERSVGRRLEKIARLAKEEPGIYGAVFDSEMYGSEIRIYQDVCFCDLCWEYFMRTNNLEIPELPADHRFDYLIHHHFIERYWQTQELRLQEILSGIRAHVDTICPQFTIGFLAFKKNWFYRGVIQGLGHSTTPVYVFSESSYVFGYTPHIEAEKAFIFEKTRQDKSLDASAKKAPHARYLPGIWLSRFFPDELLPQFLKLHRQADGYWIYSADSLWKEGYKEEPLTLHGTPSEYWSALKLAKEVSVEKSPKTELRQETHPFFYPSQYDESQKRLHQSSSLKSFLKLNLFNKMLQRSPAYNRVPNRLRTKGIVLIHGVAWEGGEIDIKCAALRPGAATANYQLFNHEGMLVQTGKLDEQQPAIRIFPATLLSESFSLIIDSGHHAIEFVCTDLPCIIEASTSFPLKLSGTAESFTMYLPANSQAVYLRAYSSRNKQAQLMLHVPAVSFYKKVELSGFTELRVPGFHLPKSMNHQVWGRLAVNTFSSELIEEIQLFFMNAELPYLLP